MTKSIIMVLFNKAMSYYFEAWQKCIVFNGRTSREAFLYFQLINFLIIFTSFLLIPFIFNPIDIIIGNYNIRTFTFYPIFLFFPQVSMAIRRLHDVGKSGWFFLLLYVPFINIWPLVLFLTKGNPGDNRYGNNTE
jgi:uncharacterized membrane protein YhaH (DUF805 family)